MRLSICIPTYNFGAFIGETLESILPQVEDGVEVVVLDGGSDDDTSTVVESFQQRYPSLRYERRDKRGGIDRDLSRTVDLARGEYCWLFGADDVMKPGAIGQMLKNLDSGCDLYLCGLTLCTFDMQPLGDHRVSRIKTESQFDLGKARDRRRYFRLAQTTPAFFSFLGSLTFKKSRWDAIGLDEEFVGSLWAHVARLFQMIPGGLRLHYLPTSYLLKRIDNDSFMDQGLINRYSIAIDGYDRLARTCFPDASLEARHVRRTVRNEFPPWLLLGLKFSSERERPEDVPAVDRLARKAYGDRTPRNLLYHLTYRHTPRPAFRAAQAVNRAVRSIIAPIRTLRRPAPPAAAR
ncbi:MAG: glycosyltransferase family 2 protein [Solirubrobacteraceae bacterium]